MIRWWWWWWWWCLPYIILSFTFKTSKTKNLLDSTGGVEDDGSAGPPNLTLASCDVDVLPPSCNSVDHLCLFAAKSVNLFSKYCAYKSGNGRTTNGRTDRRTDGPVWSIMPPASINSQRNKNHSSVQFLRDSCVFFCFYCIKGGRKCNWATKQLGYQV